MAKDHDDKNDTNEDILDAYWRTGPLAEAKKNLNDFCANMLMQQALEQIVAELKLAEEILEDEQSTATEKVLAQQTITMLNISWTSVMEQFGTRC